MRISSCRPVLRILSEFSTTPRICSESDDNSQKKQDAALKLQNLLSKLVTENVKSKEDVDSKPEVKITRPVKKLLEKRPVYKVGFL